MLPEETLQKLQRHNFDFLARQEPSGRKRLRYMGLAHLKDGKTITEVAAALRVTRHDPALISRTAGSLLTFWLYGGMHG